MITSRQNQKIQVVRALLEKRRDRQEQQAFVVEGVNLVEEALLAGIAPKIALFSDRLTPRGQILLEKLIVTSEHIEEVSSSLMASITDTETSQGILAVLPKINPVIPPGLSFVLVVDTVRDPGNLGTLFRSARAAGVELILVSPGTTDPFSPKVLRAGMGAHFHLPILEMGWNEINSTCKNRVTPGLEIVLTAVCGGTPCWQANFKKPLALVIGSEAEGASLQAQQLANYSVTIPMPGGSESLNAAVAGSILLFEIVRQRQL